MAWPVLNNEDCHSFFLSFFDNCMELVDATPYHDVQRLSNLLCPDAMARGRMSCLQFKFAEPSLLDEVF